MPKSTNGYGSSFINSLFKTTYFRFILTGGLNTLFSYSIYCLLIFIRVHYTLAVLISTILGVCFNFFSTGKLVFNSLPYGKLHRFFLLYAGLYVLNVIVITGFRAVHINDYAAGLLAAVIISVPSFIFNKLFIFNK